MKYIKVEWPDIQEYMDREDYNENCYFDPRKNCWFVPDFWEDPYKNLTEEELKDIFEDQWYGCNVNDPTQETDIDINL